jgi:poly[(R)-3-hydroxyalkanoate] polymerase subunit PhaC
MSLTQGALPEAISRLLVVGPEGADMHPRAPEARQDVLPPSSVRDIDRAFRSGIARLTGGLAPSALAGAYLDWAVHLAAAPGKQFELAGRAVIAAAENMTFALGCVGGSERDPCRCALPQDNRFRADDWQRFPFNMYAHAFLSIERWWEAATTGVRGVSKQHEHAVTFAARQALDIAAPSNFIWTNPTVLNRTRAEGGMNLLRGFANLAEDTRRAAAGEGPVGTEAFQVGKTVALTPGKVVHRTPIAEIIQYSPKPIACGRSPSSSFRPGS